MLVAAFGSALAWARSRCGFYLLPGRPLKLVPSPFFSFLLLCSSHRHRSTPASPCCRRSASIVSAKPVPASPNPCAPCQPVLVTCSRRKTPLDAFLPRGQQPHRRALRRRGQLSVVSLGSCSVYFQLRLVPVMLYDLLIAPFVHRSHRSTTVAVACSVVAAVTIELRLHCSSGLALCSVVFGVSC